MNEVPGFVGTHTPRNAYSGAVELAAARNALERWGCAVVTCLLPWEVRFAVAEEAIRLVERAGIRRDLVVAETGATPRRMRNVTRAQIVERGSVIPQLYESAAVTSVVEQVVRRAVFRCPYEPEQFVITRLEAAGDTHGWHWDDYSFALVWVAECPPEDDGGFVEYVPDTVWDKRSPDVETILVGQSVHRLAVGAGEVYLMRTNTTLHRVYPIRRGRRTIVNMAFAVAEELCAEVSHETMDTLWATSGIE
ncbi:hypothetical protein ABIA39_008571 [Nocardia sp. GAS34]|uniref:HalD/BesD family halogenase n=1 Tax=unclassified Nocardia TaxID=2637762 RepID=UPI003D25A82F